MTHFFLNGGETMFSRRKFLQAQAAGFVLPLIPTQAFGISPTHATQGPSSASLGPIGKRDYWNDWPLHLSRMMNEARDRRKAQLADLRSPKQVNDRIEAIRSHVWDIVGGPLERTALNPRVVGKIERDQYTIEKVIFESQPSVYVTAHLYVPSSQNPLAKPPFPGILAPLGHAEEGKAYRNYQCAYQNLARKGYMVLAFDPYGQGERLQYLDPKTQKSLFGSTGEHNQAGRPLLLLGASFALYRVWDGVRALDYLLSRPEVDPSRIGCTGHSGGGTMTMYLVALEPRIKVAVEVEGNSENVAGPSYDPPGAIADAEQNLVGGLPWGLDRGDLLMAFAPKPLLMTYTPQDIGSTYSPMLQAATNEIYEELRSAYAILEARDKVQLFASPLPHDLDFFNRRALYEWFNRWLGKSEAGTDEAEFESAPLEVLNCTATGQVLTSLGGRSVVDINVDRMRSIIPSPLLGDSVSDQAMKAEVRKRLRKLLGLPVERTPLHQEILSSNLRRETAMEEFVFQSQPQIRIPGWFIKPAGKKGPFPTVLYVSESGRNGVVEEPGYLDYLVKAGTAVCAIDLRGVGSTAPRHPQQGPNFYGNENLEEDYAWASLILGQPVLGQRVQDILRCLDYLATRSDVDGSQVRVLGEGGAGIAALTASALDERPRSLMLHRTLATFKSVVESKEYTVQLSCFVYGLLRELDLPDLIAALNPRTCWLLNATGPEEKPLPRSQVILSYASAFRVYAKAGKADDLCVWVEPEEAAPNTILSWSKKT